ncbi:1-phosphofructokinase family hexose kinase [Flavobacterium salilacus subsp. salilacus]|uniref:1-phosphofructokinase family hexose kinase n=1 Tax=Flavobacterium TaxID=237 RepID=UPI001074E3FF|nr:MULTISPECIES: 1-phosphofructokinase family hexose kinase [Flavobacterium]KAF2518515.1 1-phosphofructokinase family hexose kinase [Flavobacterium salilacus subsp. salilacus]MBE1615157.1 1-phosphofructokinase family hexose kinase [Flavobacterium sp. SaA2.13]
MINNVLTITLNPTVDKSSSVANIKPEKKLRCAAPKYEPGGGGINVSRGLLRLGITTTALFTAGGRTGSLLQQLLEEEDITTLPVQVAAQTRENFIVVDTFTNEQYRFGMPGEAITDSETATIYKTIKAITPFPEIVVISGSLPPGIAPVFVKTLVKLAKEKGSKVVLDTSGEALSAALEEGVYLLKPNIGELSRLSGIEHLDNEMTVQAAMQLINKGMAEVIVVSMGAQGAYLVTKEQTAHIPAPAVKKMSTVGAGDSMVAGMVAMLAKGGTVLDMVRMGVACGSAATMNPGTGLFKKEDAERLYQWLSKA